jgi:hypothetical protein
VVVVNDVTAWPVYSLVPSAVFLVRVTDLQAVVKGEGKVIVKSVFVATDDVIPH